MVLPPAYLLRSHVHESATADRKSKQQAIKKTEGTHGAVKIEESVELTESSLKTEHEVDNHAGQSKSSRSNSTEVETPIQGETSVDKTDGNISPGEFPKSNLSTLVENPTESQIPIDTSNKIIDYDKSQEKEIISCPKCGKTFERRTELTEHLKTYSTDQATCPICNKVLNSSNSRDRHLLIHSKERPYECKICKLTFTTNGNMNRHFKRHLVKQKQKGKNSEGKDEPLKKGEILQQADINKEASGTQKFQSEVEEMRRRKNYFRSLGLCRKISISKLNANIERLPEKHILKRKIVAIWEKGGNAQIPQTAQTCGNLRRKKLKNTDTVSNKTECNSILISSDDMPTGDPNDVQDLAGITDIISNVQPKTTTGNQTATCTTSIGHQSIKHNIKQSFACETCEYTAKDKNSLKRHKQTHKRSGKFKCKTCGLTFTNKANGQRHVRELHGIHDRELISDQIIFLKEETDLADEKIFTCKYCSSIFDNEQALQHHLRSSECKKKPYFCRICDIGSSTKNNCFRHIENKHPEIFTNRMTPEEKNRVKELNMKQTIYTSPRQDEDNKSKEIEAAEGLCRLSDNLQDNSVLETICATEQFHDTSRDKLVNVEAPSVAIATGMALIKSEDPIRTGPTKTMETVSSIITGTSLSMILRASPSVTTSNSEFYEDKPLDLSLNPLDLSLRKIEKIDSPGLSESTLETARAGESQMAASESNGHSQSAQNFSKNDNNSHQQKSVSTKQSIKNFKCKHCEKTFSTNSNLQRHLVNLHKQSPTIQLGSSHNPIRKDLLKECSVNSSVKHFDCNQIKNLSCLQINSKFNASYDRGTGSDTENDLASIPSIQSTVNQGIHIAHPSTQAVFSVISHINRKRHFYDLQSSDSSLPAWSQRKKHARVGPRSPTEAACSPVSVPQVVITSIDRFNDEGFIGESPGTNPENNMSAYDLSTSTHDQSFNVRLAESAEPSPSRNTDLICRYCSSQFSSKEHVNSHIKELHYLEHNNTQEVPDEKIRWKKERFSKLRQ